MKTVLARTVTIAAAAAMLFVSNPLGAQEAGQGRGRGGRAGGPPAASDWPPQGAAPRTADGHPDLTGNWQPNAIRQNVDLIGAGVEVPMLPAARAVYDKRKAALGREDPEARCLPPGVPRMSTTPYPWTIIQTPKIVAILYEGGAHVWRQIFLDGRPHDPRIEQTWLGDSIGHWDGDALVVETVGQNDISWIDAAGIPHTTDMKVTERITRPDVGHLEIVHTIEDPKTFSKPWSFTTKPSLLRGELIEYVCQENNKDIEHLVGK
jgi:hypothetical protein